MEDVLAPVARFLDGGPGLWLAPGNGQAPDGCVVVATSGSTGTAKPVVLSREALTAAADAASQRLGFEATWHLALSPRYVAGLMVLVRGLRGSGVRFASPDLSGLSAVAGRNCVSIVATQLFRAVADREIAARLAEFDAVLVGGAALPAPLRASAEAAGIRVIETYGMSETCGGVVWDGVALPGVGVTLDASGRISITGPTLMNGYLGQAPLAAQAPTDGATPVFHTQDRGRWSDGRLALEGRVDDVVISGGVNVDLAQVRRVVAGHDADAAVIAVDDEEWGARVVLFAQAGTLAQWRDRMREELPAACLPRQFVQVARLPRTAGGKPDRGALLGLLQSTL